MTLGTHKQSQKITNLLKLGRKKTMPKNELKNCPFCNSPNVELDEIWQENLSINCQDCRAYGPIKKDFDDGETAIKAWNTRAPDSKLREALEMCITTLRNRRIGYSDYMEGSQIYEDFDNAATQAEAALAGEV